MNIKQKILTVVMMLGAVVTMNVMLAPVTNAANCGGTETSIIDCPQTGGSKSAKDSGVWGILLIALNIMTAGVGILAVGGIVYGSILYASAQEDASQVQKAKDIIKNVVIGLIAYGAMYLLLNFIVPGGIFET
jgi:hypothetical protein